MESGLKFAVGAILLSIVSSYVVQCSEPKPEESFWDEIWPTHLLVASTAGLASGVVYFGTKAPSSPRWTGGILFDDWFRNALRGRTSSSREVASTVSDVLLGASVMAPITLASIDRDRWRSLFKITESFLLTELVVLSTKHGVGRKRPGFTTNDSFISGHAAVAFWGAGSICSGQTDDLIRSNHWSEWVACGSSLVVAGLTSVLRVVGDRHYSTDITIGGIVGFGFGFLLPRLTYHFRDRVAFSPILNPGSAGLQVGFLLN